MTRIHKALMLGLLEDYATHRIDAENGLSAEYRSASTEAANIVKKIFENLLDKEVGN